MADNPRLAGSGRGVLRPVVLVASAMARLQGGDGGRGALAAAGNNSIRARVRCCPALCLGLRLDGARHARPIAPPRRLVLVGFYRHVRNPMYVSFAAGWIVLWVVFGHANAVAIAAVAAVALGVHLFVVFYEEPTLRKKFGAEYEEYCQNVNRWWPCVRGWDKPY